MACSLTHLIFHKSTFLYSEIAEYQRKREKRIKQLSSRGMNWLSPSLQHTVYFIRVFALVAALGILSIFILVKRNLVLWFPERKQHTLGTLGFMLFCN